MKIRTHLLLLAVICLSISCRKDPAIVLPEPNGNVLILEVDASFAITGGNELWVDNLMVNDGLMELEIVASAERLNVLVTGSNDTIFDIANGQINKPVMHQISNLTLADGRLYNSILPSDFVSLTPHKLDTTNLLIQVGNKNLVHAYLKQVNHSKISFLRVTSQEFDPELGLTYPVMRRYVLVGYEK